MPVKKQNYFFYLLIKWSLPYTMPLIALIVGVSILLMNEREYLKEGIKMTREEAIDTLKNGLWWDRKQLDEAIDIAVSALRPVSRERMKQERDAAVKDIPHECKTCAYHMVSFNGCTPDHDCTNPDGGCSNNYDRWIWRGQKED